MDASLATYNAVLSVPVVEEYFEWIFAYRYADSSPLLLQTV